jgi:hypothetical protein
VAAGSDCPRQYLPGKKVRHQGSIADCQKILHVWTQPKGGMESSF